MMKKMDGELEEHFAALEARAAARGERGKDPEGWTEENWEEEMASHPFFNQGWKEGEELSPLMQGMQVGHLHNCTPAPLHLHPCTCTESGCESHARAPSLVHMPKQMPEQKRRKTNFCLPFLMSAVKSV